MNDDTTTTPDTTKANLSRRGVAKGAAWSVPAITVAAAAPAIAASPVPSVRGASYFFDTYKAQTPSNTIDAVVGSSSTGGCSYTVVNAPASVANLSATYWLPIPDYQFTPSMSSSWTTLVRDASQPTKVGPTKGLTYYPYTTTYTGTGDTSTTCGPGYLFTAPVVDTAITNPAGSYYYQLTYTLNGATKSNPLQAINTP